MNQSSFTPDSHSHNPSPSRVDDSDSKYLSQDHKSYSEHADDGDQSNCSIGLQTCSPLDTRENEEADGQWKCHINPNNSRFQLDLNRLPRHSLERDAEVTYPHKLSTDVSLVMHPIDYVGIINEGCTCYLNSLLQMLFHIGYLRSAVYRIPVENNNSISVYKALQELFFQMQERTTPARTKKLTDSFGWGERELFVQHDIQEMATLLRDNLEEKMKDTVTEGAINQLFEGRGEQFVETLDKAYISRSKDIFYDIHIPLGEHTNLLDGIKFLTAREQLVGDNKYKVELEGKAPVYKDAEKGYEFKKFPYVIWFHLKRFAMDLTSPTLEMKKVNSQMEFPVVLDLTELERGYSPEEQMELFTQTKRGAAVKALSTDSPAIYDLQGVIVHRGTVRSGHYYCYIREWDPVKQCFTRWLEFEDEKVSAVAEEVAVSFNYGGYHQTSGGFYRGGSSNDTNAYILSYVRRADAPTILASPPTDIIAQRVKDAMRSEMEEEERCAKLEKELKQLVTLYVITDSNLAEYCAVHQIELFARDLRIVKNFTSCVLEFKKTALLTSVYEAIAAEPFFARRGLKPTACRLWQWTNNRGFHPSTPMDTHHESLRRSTCLSNYLSPNDQEKPMAICVYLQEPVQIAHYLPPAADVHALIKRFAYDVSKGACSVVLRAPTVLRGLSVLVDALYMHTCKVQIIVTHGHKEMPPKIYKCSLYENRLYVPLDHLQPVEELLFQCCSPTEVLPVREVHLEGDPADLPPAAALTKPTLAKIGMDRVLLFLKFFDHTSCTVRYLGSAPIDRTASLQSCEPLFFALLGIPYSPAHHGGQPKFRYFEETKGVVVRALEAVKADLFANRLQDGSVVVLQSAEIPPVMRHFHVETYYRSLRLMVDVQVHEVVSQVCPNEEEFRQALKEHRELAVIQKKLLQEEATETSTGSAAAFSSASALPSSSMSIVLKREPSVGSSSGSLVLTPTSSQPPTQLVLAAKPEEAYLYLNPYNTPLPVLGRSFLRVQGGTVCAMCTCWGYGTICDRIARAEGLNPNQIRLYRNVSPATAKPAERAVRSAASITLDALLLDGYAAGPVLFYERLAQPRSVVERSPEVVVTLRDKVGHALHCERYALPPLTTLQGLVRAVRQSIRPYEIEENPWRTLSDTLIAPHYVLLAYDRDKKLIRHILEIPMTANTKNNVFADPTGGKIEEIRLSSLLFDYDFDLQPAAALRPGEQRIACCHGEYLQDCPLIFGHPFIITVNPKTTVNDALREILQITHVPPTVLNCRVKSGHNYGVMMLTESPLHFDQWDQYISLFWHHTPNNSGFIPNLMLNHPRPLEKPGSRYVAHNSPRLKISNN
ncbi:unnamed protein product [Phytomonas sp. Hart1]|nr:unnamed protein product [Phytomonas sp. Hart1]|eukprot:CCW67804.1 unnamed protein product [Phytomonas sp. isolate Hart1]